MRLEMEDKWLGYLIEAGILLFLALLYYLFQRKRIIQVDKDEIFQIADFIYGEIENIEKEKALSAEVKQLKSELYANLDKADFEAIQVQIRAMNLPIHPALDEHISYLKSRLDFYK